MPPGSGRAVVAVLCFVAGAAVRAHDVSTASIGLKLFAGGAQGEWRVAVPDLQRVLELDGNSDGAITWGELRSSRPQLQSLLNRSLRLQQATASCHHTLQQLLVEQSRGRHFAVLRFSSSCEEVGAPQEMEYRFLASIDALHIASYTISGEDWQINGTLSAEVPRVTLASTAVRTPGPHHSRAAHEAHHAGH